MSFVHSMSASRTIPLLEVPILIQKWFEDHWALNDALGRAKHNRIAHRAINQSKVDLEALIESLQDLYWPKRLPPGTMGLQIHGPGLQETAKRWSWTTEWLSAPSIKQGLCWKHSQDVHKTPIDQKDLDQRQCDYKSIDLDYKKQQKGDFGPQNGLQHHQ